MIRVLRRIAGRIRNHLQARAANARAAAQLRGLSDRDLADMAINRADIVAIENGTYVDPRDAIFAARRVAATARAAKAARAEADARAAAAVHKIAA